MDILALLKPRKNSVPELETSLKEIDGEIEQALENIDEAEENILEAVFDGPQKVDQLTQAIAQKRIRIETLKTAKSSVTDQIARLKKKESDAKTEAKGAEARAVNKLLRDDLLELHNMAKAMATVLQRAADREEEIRKANVFLRSANAKHLLVTDPINALIQKIGPLQVSASQAAVMADVPNPVTSFRLPGYWPPGPWAKPVRGGEEHYIGRLSEVEL